MGLCQLLPLAMMLAHSFHAQGATQTQNMQELLARNVDANTAGLVLQIEYSSTPQNAELSAKTLEIGCLAKPGVLIYHDGSRRGHQRSYEGRGR